MDKETRNILAVLGVAIVILYIARPKSKGVKSKASDNLSSRKTYGKSAVSPPKTTQSDEDKQFENAVVSIKAVRNALNNNEPQSEIDKLNRILLKDYGIKVFKTKDTEKLIARDSKGKDIAKEQ